MIDKVSTRVQLQQQSIAAQQQMAQNQSFGAVFQQELDKAKEPDQGVAFSKHAIARAEERGIEITPSLIDQLKGSMIRAQAKGAKNILAMDTEKAFIINVPMRSFEKLLYKIKSLAVRRSIAPYNLTALVFI